MTAYSETSSTKIPKQEVNNQNPKSGPNFVLVNSGSSISSLFGDILPFYPSYKQLSSVIVATSESLAKLILYSHIFLVCITSFIAEFINNSIYFSYLVISAFISLVSRIPDILVKLVNQTIDLGKTLVHNESREMLALQLKVDARIAWNKTKKLVFNTIETSKKLYLAIFVILIMTGLSLPAITRQVPLTENSFFFRFLNSNQTVVKAGGEITVDQSIITTSESFDNDGEGFLVQRVLEHKPTEVDTYESIAELYGVSVETVLGNNNLTIESAMPESLIIPSSDGYIYQTVVDTSPDDLERIYGIDKNLIYSQNEDAFDQEKGKFSQGTLLVIPTTDFAAIADANQAEEKRKENLRLAQEQKARREEALARSRRSTYANATSGAQSAGFIWPTSGNVTRCVTGYHVACDIANGSLPPIFSAQSGTVAAVYRYSVSGYGLAVVVDHGNGLQTLYAHMSEIYVSAGQSLNQGQSVGRMGCTGYCTGAHLHFEVRQNGVKQNPLRYLP
jgi:murein DD-endopeptidase MepM/ murein hydrolase activator NlpD